MSAAHQDVSDHRPKAEVTGRRRPVGGVLQATSSVVGANDSPLDSPRTPLSASSTSSIGNILRGHGLAPSDSRTLPVLDNIWGSFVSETAFGSLPPSPSDSIMGRNRVTKLQSSASRRQTIESTNSPETPRGLPRRRQWNLDLPPPSSPPVVELPPTPIGQSPAMALPLGSVERRKLSRSPSKRGMLLTPPISPTEELEIQGLDALLSASNSDNSLLASSYNSSSVSSINSRDLPSRLVRSASSPVIRSPESPVLSVVSDKNSRSWLSVDLPRLDSIAPLSRSQTSSQRTPVPGTPIASPFSIGDPDLAYLGASSGTPTLILSIPRSESGHVGVPNELTQNDTQLRYPSFPSVPMEDSDINLSMFPAVPLGIFKPNGREMNRGGTCGETRPANWSEESLLTPPITPAWFAQAFDTPSDDEQEGIKTGETK
ncbi:hypothetical protein FRC09_008115 [Ceratobasidium sp. 395]|nr:hypothetical protein FRC09_008115 [Ceratobasidium sp. 395]